MVFPSKNISEYASLTLEQLAAHYLGDKLSLGGAFGLLHYLDYILTIVPPTMLMPGGLLKPHLLNKKPP